MKLQQRPLGGSVLGRQNGETTIIVEVEDISLRFEDFPILNYQRLRFYVLWHGKQKSPWSMILWNLDILYNTNMSIYAIFFDACHPKELAQTIKFLHLEVQIEILTPRTACWRPFWSWKVSSQIFENDWTSRTSWSLCFFSEWNSTQFKTHRKKHLQAFNIRKYDQKKTNESSFIGRPIVVGKSA